MSGEFSECHVRSDLSMFGQFRPGYLMTGGVRPGNNMLVQIMSG
jgi:hypothetical protein